MSESDLLETMVERLLAEGVPPGVIARAFELDADLVKDRQSELRKVRYGTDDLAEYMEQMQWTAVEEALTTMRTGSVAEKTRVMASVLGKQMALSARRTPESQRKLADKVTDMFKNMREGEAREPGAQSRFVATLQDVGEAGSHNGA